jgi:hypothetical protein
MRPLLLMLACSFVSNALADDYVKIKGQVKWGGKELPKLVPVTSSRDSLPKGILPPVSNEYLVHQSTFGFKNVIVWLRPDSEDRQATFPTESIKRELREPVSSLHIIKMPGFQFEPRVIAARAGDQLAEYNDTPYAHNTNYEFGDGVGHNGPPRPAGKINVVRKSLDASTTPNIFSSNIYPWMSGRIRVFSHPYFAITDDDGRFEIKDAPSGKWRIVYWHENGFHKGREGILGFRVDVKPDRTNGNTLEMKPVIFEMPGK